MTLCFGPCQALCSNGAICGRPSTGLMFSNGEPIGPCCDECAEQDPEFLYEAERDANGSAVGEAPSAQGRSAGASTEPN